jgi:hypothetical protein
MNKRQKKKLKRKAKKKREKKIAHEQEQKMRNQMNMFDRMPDSCSACKEIFPKTREAHMSWRVVVRNEKQQVRLFCPTCQELATKVAGEQNEI